jgi:hypothetical protein
MFFDLSRTRLEVLTGAGHDISLEQPILAADRVIDFLKVGVCEIPAVTPKEKKAERKKEKAERKKVVITRKKGIKC